MQKATNKSVIPMLLILAILFLPSCWKTDGNEMLAEQYGQDGDEDVEEEADIPEVDLGEIEGDSLAGRWAMKMSMQGTINPMGSEWTISLTNLFIADVDEERNEMSLTFCDQIVDIDTGDGASDLGKSEVPAMLRDALAQTPLSISLQGSDEIPEQQSVWTWGLHELDDPANDSLPEDAANEFVWDQDEDGNPGVTLKVISPAGNRYMVRRAVWDMESAPMSDDAQSIDGSLTFRVDEIALDADNELLKTVAPITPKQEGNSYRLVRVGAVEDDAYDCENLRADHLGLFAEDAQ